MQDCAVQFIITVNSDNNTTAMQFNRNLAQPSTPEIAAIMACASEYVLENCTCECPHCVAFKGLATHILAKIKEIAEVSIEVSENDSIGEVQGHA